MNKYRTLRKEKERERIIGCRKVFRRGRLGTGQARVQSQVAQQVSGTRDLRYTQRGVRLTRRQVNRRPRQRADGQLHCEAAKPVAFTRENLDYIFRLSKRQVHPGDVVQVTRWGRGVVADIRDGRVKVFAHQFGATGATIYVGYDRLQLIG